MQSHNNTLAFSATGELSDIGFVKSESSQEDFDFVAKMWVPIDAKGLIRYVIKAHEPRVISGTIGGVARSWCTRIKRHGRARRDHVGLAVPKAML
jgi:hypothetical protein